MGRLPSTHRKEYKLNDTLPVISHEALSHLFANYQSMIYRMSLIDKPTDRLYSF
jgi:hypothetical protein